MSEFRRGLFDSDTPPADLSADAALLVKRQVAATVLLERDRSLYTELFARYHAEGPSRELSELALEAAGDLGAVLQSLRSRPDMLQALEDRPSLTGPPLIVFDQLQFSYLLLTDGAPEEHRDVLLSPEELDELLSLPEVTDWLKQLQDPSDLR